MNERIGEHMDKTADPEPFINTYSGVVFYLTHPRAEDVRDEDIAHALGNLCRFNGHCSEFYSVAQHSIDVRDRMHPAVPPTRDDEEWVLAALLHDAAEAYLGDVCRPLKALLSAYRDIYAPVEAVIAEHYRLPVGMLHSARMKTADSWALELERRSLMRGMDMGPWHTPPEMPTDESPIVALPPAEAGRRYLECLQRSKQVLGLKGGSHVD